MKDCCGKPTTNSFKVFLGKICGLKSSLSNAVQTWTKFYKVNILPIPVLFKHNNSYYCIFFFLVCACVCAKSGEEEILICFKGPTWPQEEFFIANLQNKLTAVLQRLYDGFCVALAFPISFSGPKRHQNGMALWACHTAGLGIAVTLKTTSFLPSLRWVSRSSLPDLAPSQSPATPGGGRIGRLTKVTVLTDFRMAFATQLSRDESLRARDSAALLKG